MWLLQHVASDVSLRGHCNASGFQIWISLVPHMYVVQYLIAVSTLAYTMGDKLRLSQCPCILVLIHKCGVDTRACTTPLRQVNVCTHSHVTMG